MSEPQTSPWSQRQWDLLEEQLDSKLISELLQDEQHTEEQVEETEEDRKRKRKFLFDRLKAAVLNDAEKLALVQVAVSTKQPELADALSPESDENTAYAGARDLGE